MSVDILGTNCDQCLSMVQCCFKSTETVRLIRTHAFCPGLSVLMSLTISVDVKPRTATSTFTQLLNSAGLA